jgi:hypothetical protein
MRCDVEEGPRSVKGAEEELGRSGCRCCGLMCCLGTGRRDDGTFVGGAFQIGKLGFMETSRPTSDFCVLFFLHQVSLHQHTWKLQIRRHSLSIFLIFNQKSNIFIESIMHSTYFLAIG